MPFDPVDWSPGPEADPPRRQMTKREERLLAWCICLLLAGFFIAPIGGVSIVHLVAFLAR